MFQGGERLQHSGVAQTITFWPWNLLSLCCKVMPNLGNRICQEQTKRNWNLKSQLTFSHQAFAHRCCQRNCAPGLDHLIYYQAFSSHFSQTMSSSGPRTTWVQEFKRRFEPRWEEWRRTRRRWRRTRRWRRRRRRAEKWSQHRSEFAPSLAQWRRPADWDQPSDRHQCDPTHPQHIAHPQPEELLSRGTGGDRLQQHLCRQILNLKIEHWTLQKSRYQRCVAQESRSWLSRRAPWEFGEFPSVTIPSRLAQKISAWPLFQGE